MTNEAISHEEVQRIMKRIAECDVWIKEFKSRAQIHQVWASALDGVMRSKQNYLDQINGRIIEVKV